MLIHPEIIAAATDRLNRKHGARVLGVAPKLRTPPLPQERWARVATYINNNRSADDTFALERAIGTNDLVSLYYLWAGLRAARSVARVSISPGPGDPGGLATGFMIAPGLFLTNWHVFPTAEAAERSKVQFNYEAGSQGNEKITTWFDVKPKQFFFTNKDLDYTLVALDPTSKQGPDLLESFGWLRLNPDLGKTDYGQYLSIIQHPNGQPKQLAIRENKLFPFDETDNFLSYQSDTAPGSSGSPVFNDLWDVVALHHSGKPLKDAGGHYIDRNGNPITDRQPDEGDIQWIANEGARTSRIVKDLLDRVPAGEVRDQLQASFAGGITPAESPLELSDVDSAKLNGPPASLFTQPSGAKPPESGFLMVLPLNVAVKVESLAQPPKVPPSPATVAAVAAAVAAPAPIVKAPGEAPDLEKLNFDTNYGDRRGYDEAFLGRDRVAAMPTIKDGSKSQIAPNKKRGNILHYHHYSVMVHKTKRMPVLSACNTDYSDAARSVTGRDTFGKDEWIQDSRMSEEYQLTRGFYDRWKRLDYGHLVRRDDNAWGASKKEIEYANSDTFHLTNCTPQHEAFNRDAYGYHGLWGQLENLISTQAKSDRDLARLCIFAGPIFGSHDLRLKDEDGDVFVPLSFWKVVVAPTQRGGLKAFGFVVSQEAPLQDDAPFEEFTPRGFTEHQVSLAKIESKTIVEFSDDLKRVDSLADHPSGGEEVELKSLDDLWTGPR